MLPVNQYIANCAYITSDFKAFGVWYLLFVKDMVVISWIIGKLHVKEVPASVLKGFRNALQ